MRERTPMTRWIADYALDLKLAARTIECPMTLRRTMLEMTDQLHRKAERADLQRKTARSFEDDVDADIHPDGMFRLKAWQRRQWHELQRFEHGAAEEERAA